MGAEKLELHFAFRKAVADRPGVWDAVQASLRDFHARRVRRATMLRSVAWLSLGTMLIGTLLLFSPLAPPWLDARLYVLFLVFGWALAELWQQARRRRPWLLPALSPRALPEAAREFLEACRGRAVWWDRRERSCPIRASDLEPAEALMILSDDADIRDQALPYPKDLDEPVAALVILTEPSPWDQDRRAQPERTPKTDGRSALPDPSAGSAGGLLNPAPAPADDGRNEPYRRGLIRRSWTVYGVDAETFATALRDLFDPDLAGPGQRDFFVLRSVHVAWERKPWIDNPSDLAAEASATFARAKAEGLIPGNVMMPDRRSLDRLFWEERREFVQLRRLLGLPPKPRALTRPSAERREARSGEETARPPLRDCSNKSI